MTLDDILRSVQPVACDDVARHQQDAEIDRARQRVERLIRRGADARDIERALATLHRIKGS